MENVAASTQFGEFSEWTVALPHKRSATLPHGHGRRFLQ